MLPYSQRCSHDAQKPIYAPHSVHSPFLSLTIFTFLPKKKFELGLISSHSTIRRINFHFIRNEMRLYNTYLFEGISLLIRLPVNLIDL
jgi:hypothetical protein